MFVDVHIHAHRLFYNPQTWMNCLPSAINAGMCEGTPWHSEVKVIGERHCIQTFRKEADHDPE